MAYAFTVTTTIERSIAGRRYTTIEVDETDLGPDEMAAIPFPQVATVTLFEAELTVPGTAATLDPELYLATDPTPDTNLLGTLNEVSTTTTPAVRHRVQSDLRVAAAAGLIYLRSKPDVAGGATSTAKTRITWVEGHSA